MTMKFNEPKRVKHRVIYSGHNEVDEFGTISDITNWMNIHSVPLYARLVYQGCGTHNIAFEWSTTEYS